MAEYDYIVVGAGTAGCALGGPVTDDLSGRQQEGVAWIDLAIAGGERVSSAEAYLRPAMGCPNLAVQTDCRVHRLIVRHGRCTGVRYVRDGAPEEVRAADQRSAGATSRRPAGRGEPDAGA